MAALLGDAAILDNEDAVRRADGREAVRAQQTEAALQGQPWTEATVQQAMRVLQAEFSPISDMRASGDYRRTVLGNLLQRFWLESQGGAPASIAQLQATHLESAL